MSDLDNEELKATKKLQEKTADEMFEELGYSKNEDPRLIIYGYTQRFNNFTKLKKIYFYKIEKDITFRGYNMTEDLSIDFNLTMQELQAIKKKVEELEWN